MILQCEFRFNQTKLGESTDGCSDSVCKREATARLGTRAELEIPGPKKLCGVGNQVLETKHGIWKRKREEKVSF